jgi:hypothetical protein
MFSVFSLKGQYREMVIWPITSSLVCEDSILRVSAFDPFLTEVGHEVLVHSVFHIGECAYFHSAPSPTSFWHYPLLLCLLFFSLFLFTVSILLFLSHFIKILEGKL